MHNKCATDNISSDDEGESKVLKQLLGNRPGFVVNTIQSIADRKQDKWGYISENLTRTPASKLKITSIQITLRGSFFIKIQFSFQLQFASYNNGSRLVHIMTHKNVI